MSDLATDGAAKKGYAVVRVLASKPDLIVSVIFNKRAQAVQRKYIFEDASSGVFRVAEIKY